MPALFAAVCSITTTRRRRFLWAAWWTAPPERQPFRKPDASSGGARTREEAFQQAEQAAGVSLIEIEPRWARAWSRVLVGQPPWDGKETKRETSGTRHAAAVRKGSVAVSVWSILGLTANATADELKRAFHKRALETHPDRGGEAEAFQKVQLAYEEASRRVARRKPRSR